MSSVSIAIYRVLSSKKDLLLVCVRILKILFLSTLFRSYLLNAKNTPDLSASSCSQAALFSMVEWVERMMVSLSVTPVEETTRE